ncbi:MAG: tetratricopeptide repeat protein, partial [Alphaproteobacteria bacterium]|nr:tetratricopeptide repeat protein [Alphaproteobacteria bacterium]
IEFRAGINVGDVIAEEHDIFGDGVNVAARLEALAKPGGICVSGTVRDHIGDRLPYAFEDMGEQSVKNIAHPVRVYASHPKAAADLLAPRTLTSAPHRRNIAGTAIGAAVTTLLVIAASAWWVWPATKPSPATPVAAATSIAQPLVAPRLSIVVLPFTNLSDDPKQQYFVDGVTEDLTTDLSRIEDMLVISRNTAVTYRNKPVDTRQIGRELGVRYVLEGAVQRSANQVRVTAQLIDAVTDTHLWAERFDHNTSNLFALQDEITSRIANTLGVELIAAEAARPTEHPHALDYILRGRAAFLKGPTRENYAEAISLFERALALDPRSVEAQAGLALTIVNRVLERWGMTGSVAADLARAKGLIDQALAASPRSAFAHLVKGQLLRAQGRIEEALLEYETVIASDRNSVGGLMNVARCKMLTGSLDEAIPLMEQAIRLSPHNPYNGPYFASIGIVRLLQSRTDEAIAWFEKARSANPELLTVHADLAAAYGLNGETERAATELAEARRLSRDDRYSSIARLKAAGSYGSSNGYWGVPKVQALYESTYFAGLRKAGMPEE